MKKEGSKQYKQTVSADLEEEQIFVAPLLIIDVNQFLKYEIDKQQPLFDHTFDVR